MISLLLDLLVDSLRRESARRRKARTARVRRYYENERRFGCGCCDGPPSL